MRWWRAGVAVACVAAMLVVGGRFTFAAMRAGSEAPVAARHIMVEALALDVDAKAAREAGLSVPPAPGGASQPREVLAALESLGRVTRLAAPRLVAQDGETADPGRGVMTSRRGSTRLQSQSRQFTADSRGGAPRRRIVVSLRRSRPPPFPSRRSRMKRAVLAPRSRWRALIRRNGVHPTSGWEQPIREPGGSGLVPATAPPARAFRTGEAKLHQIS